MKRILIQCNGREIEANYTKSMGELMSGLFKDPSRPLLMEFHFIFRPVKISSRSRSAGGRTTQLPQFGMVTFDKKFDEVRRFPSVEQEIDMQMFFDEKYILEVPYGCDSSLLELTKLKWRDAP